MPPRHRLLKICAMLLLAAAAPPPLVLSAPPPLAPQLAAFPRIAAPLTPQTIRINAALDAADQRARAAAAQCRDDAAPQPWSFSRTVTVAMRGPKFLAFTAADETDCGGAHPNAGIFALVYDLSTGAPINWAAICQNP